ncbi:MAG: STAS domain-containing protein [Proteobacteria bacterium]|nr:STAS domain-containing protein [Pseudomonadota bacterium]MBU4129392.1 STAS domain-containing protein [Pseudomonadota bacterium]
MGFKIESSEKDGIARVIVEGEIDMFTSPNLRDTFLPFFKKKVRGIVVDFTQVSFMDSSGIATLVEGLQWSKRENRKFILTGLGTTVFNALSLTKLDNVFSIKKDVREALDWIGKELV